MLLPLSLSFRGMQEGLHTSTLSRKTLVNSIPLKPPAQEPSIVRASCASSASFEDVGT